jgi:hypothetical protein
MLAKPKRNWNKFECEMTTKPKDHVLNADERKELLSCDYVPGELSTYVSFLFVFCSSSCFDS